MAPHTSHSPKSRSRAKAPDAPKSRPRRQKPKARPRPAPPGLDRVEEASVESFPCSDPPGYYNIHV